MPIRHAVRQGDSVAKLAYEYGFFVDTIWDHPDNSALRAERENMDALLPGDVIVIPDKTAKSYAESTDQRHEYRRKGVPAVFRLQLFRFDQPRANEPFSIEIDGVTYDGTTDGDGLLKISLPPNAAKGVLTIGPDDEQFELLFGHMDPIEELQGVQKRLNNLGFDCGEPSGEMNGATAAAIRRFQDRFDLPETGELDEQTREKIQEIHDSRNEYRPEEEHR